MRVRTSTVLAGVAAILLLGGCASESAGPTPADEEHAKAQLESNSALLDRWVTGTGQEFQGSVGTVASPQGQPPTMSMNVVLNPRGHDIHGVCTAEEAGEITLELNGKGPFTMSCDPEAKVQTVAKAFAVGGRQLSVHVLDAKPGTAWAVTPLATQR